MSSYTNKKNEEMKQKRSTDAMSLEQFAFNKTKGTARAIAKYREKKEKRFTEKAYLLKKYKKAMKKEGYQAGKGASRKRTIDNEQPQQEDVSTERMYKKRKKTDPFAKAKASAVLKKNERIRDLEEKEIQKKNYETKLLERKKKTKLMKKRTRKGQPIMKNIITGILDKLEGEQK